MPVSKMSFKNKRYIHVTNVKVDTEPQERITISVPRSMKEELRKRAKDVGMTLTKYLNVILEQQVSDDE